MSCKGAEGKTSTRLRKNEHRWAMCIGYHCLKSEIGVGGELFFSLGFTHVQNILLDGPRGAYWRRQNSPRGEKKNERLQWSVPLEAMSSWGAPRGQIHRVLTDGGTVRGGRKEERGSQVRHSDVRRVATPPRGGDSSLASHVFGQRKEV